MYVIGVGTGDATCRGSKSGALFMFTDRSSGQWIQNYNVGTGSGRFRTPLPYGISVVNRPTSTATYGGRTYICGWTTYNLVLDEHHRLWKQGMRGPEVPPTVSGASGTGAIAFTSWFDELTGERSPLSEGTVISTAVPRTWTLPARPPDDVFVSDGLVSGSPVAPQDNAARTLYLRPGDRVAFPDLAASISYNLVHETWEDGVFTTDQTGVVPGAVTKMKMLPFCRATHCETWLSVAGGLPRLVMRVPIGMTSLVESIATADLGESFIGSFERFPRCSMNVVWNDRQIMAGDPDNPDTVYMSDLFYPERYAGLNFRTRDGAPVTGILALRDYCLIFSRDKTYMLQGYTQDDFSFSMVEQSLGSIGHNCNAVVHGSGYVWTEKGPYMYNGSWHPLSPDNLFAPPIPSQSTAINRSRAVVDPDSNTFILVPDGVQLKDRYLGTYPSATHLLVFDYTTVQPETGGSFSTARFSLDTQDVDVTNSDGLVYGQYLYHYLSDKWGLGNLYSMSYSQARAVELGLSEQSFFIFQHNRMNDHRIVEINDSAVISTFVTHPNFEVWLGHYYFDDPGGSVMEGKTFKRLWMDARTYLTGATLTLYPGDDDALEMQAGTVQLTTPGIFLPSGISFNIPEHLIGIGADGEGAVGPVLKFTLDRVSGRGLSLVFKAPGLGAGASFRGFGGAFIEGPATRYGFPTTE